MGMCREGLGIRGGQTPEAPAQPQQEELHRWVQPEPGTVRGRDQEADADMLRTWCRDHLAPYKVPSTFIFMAIPRTSTGKIQKFVLREQARNLEVGAV